MSKEISVRKGPGFGFIIPEHRIEFEQKVIDSYEKTIKQKELSIYHVPHVDVDLFNYLELADPIHYVAARLSHSQNDEQFYDHHLKHLSYDAQFKVAVDYMKSFQDDVDHRVRTFYDELFYFDIVEVLKFHHMTFVDVWETSDFGNHFVTGDFYKNLPWMGRVW